MRHLLPILLLALSPLLASSCSSDDVDEPGDGEPICAAISEPCVGDSDCCEGTCRASSVDPQGATSCLCENEGSACSDDADCCSDHCGSGFCREAACLALDQPCATTPECCGDTVCDEGACTACAAFGDDCRRDGDCCSGTCSTIEGCVE